MSISRSACARAPPDSWSGEPSLAGPRIVEVAPLGAPRQILLPLLDDPVRHVDVGVDEQAPLRQGPGSFGEVRLAATGRGGGRKRQQEPRRNKVTAAHASSLRPPALRRRKKPVAVYGFP
jgi:hypothetical protein